ncbi:MAG TPA: alpha/beta fold hydrolase [Acidimicrobiia bacterium]|nr:alpha/beta fold hydrolase [Acidimicrobiia bacterium]
MRSEPVVLVHGLGSSYEHGWRPAGWIDLLADAGRRVVPVDVLGHGTAAAPHDPVAYAHLEQSVATLLPEEPFDAIGFSLGAQLLLRIAARAPARFGRLVVIGVGANLFRDEESGALADAFERGAVPDDVTARLFVQLAASAGNDPLAMAACLRRAREPFTADELACVSCPTLVIIGDRDFAGPPDPLIEALPNAELRVLPGIDHFRVTSEFACIDAALEFIGASP